MINIKKQIDYWVRGAEDDLVTATLLIENNRLLHGLFFCHLVMEKIIKAHVVKESNEIAPRTHNLMFLLQKAKVAISEEDEIFLGVLMKYQLEGRYPDYTPLIPWRETVESYLTETKKLLSCLRKKL
ncbi:MAG: HEPN domain-containing protein [Clostridia bacterium]|nr:HEPN domain-containing protein [Clostridia bacterium]